MPIGEERVVEDETVRTCRTSARWCETALVNLKALAEASRMDGAREPDRLPSIA